MHCAYFMTAYHVRKCSIPLPSISHLTKEEAFFMNVEREQNINLHVFILLCFVVGWPLWIGNIIVPALIITSSDDCSHLLTFQMIWSSCPTTLLLCRSEERDWSYLKAYSCFCHCNDKLFVCRSMYCTLQWIYQLLPCCKSVVTGGSVNRHLTASAGLHHGGISQKKIS